MTDFCLMLYYFLHCTGSLSPALYFTDLDYAPVLWVISAGFKKTHIIVLLNSLASSRSFLSQEVFEISMRLGFA